MRERNQPQGVVIWCRKPKEVRRLLKTYRCKKPNRAFKQWRKNGQTTFSARFKGHPSFLLTLDTKRRINAPTH